MSKLPEWPKHGRVSLDVETRDESLKKFGIGVRRGGYVAGIGMAIEDGPSLYLPVRHQGGDNLPAEQVWAYLRAQAKHFRGIVVGANFGYDLDYFLENGVEFPEVKFFRDVQIAEPLIDDLQDKYNLEAICERHGIPGKDERLLRLAAEEYGVHPKKELWKLPGRFAAEYGIADVLRPLQLLRRQERIIEEQDLWQIFDLESRVLPVCVKMRRIGVRIDFDQLDKVERWSIREEQKAVDQIYEETGVRIGLGEITNKAGPVAALQKIGVKLNKTPAGESGKLKGAAGYQLRSEDLDAIDHPVAELIRRARKTNKIRTTFVNSIRTHEVNGRIHCTFQQLRKAQEDETKDERGARYGRMAATGPNMQQQPSRDPEIGPMWRAIYIPDEGGLWICADYSKQEPRMLVHYAELIGCKGARAMADRYRAEPEMDIYIVLGEVTGTGYNDSKQIYLGLSYSMGGGKLCRKIGKPTMWKKDRRGQLREFAGPEGQAILDQFHKEAPFIRQLAQEVEKAAKSRGYVRTILGRKCRFPWDDEKKEYWYTHKGLNRIIQGGSADQAKQAMVDADAAGHPLQLPVHDELNETGDRERAEDLRDIMVNAVTLNVPTIVGLGIGVNWGDAK